MKNQFIIAFGLLFAGFSPLGMANDADRLIAELSFCDHRFFQEISRSADQLKRFGNIATDGKYGTFAVKDRANRGEQFIKFNTPINGKTSLLGYYERVYDLGSLRRDYTWGFLVTGSVASNHAAILPLINNGSRLRTVNADGNIFSVVSEIYDRSQPDKGWVVDDSLKSDSFPKSNTIERVFLIEDSLDGLPEGAASITCSLQGENIPDEILKSVRPDLDVQK